MNGCTLFHIKLLLVWLGVTDDTYPLAINHTDVTVEETKALTKYVNPNLSSTKLIAERIALVLFALVICCRISLKVLFVILPIFERNLFCADLVHFAN